MVDVSNGWKELTNGTLLPQTHIAIICTATEPGLQQDASVSGNNPEDFSDMNNTGESSLRFRASLPRILRLARRFSPH